MVRAWHDDVHPAVFAPFLQRSWAATRPRAPPGRRRARAASEFRAHARGAPTFSAHARAAPESRALTPRQLGPYVVLGEIGGGGMGTVYRVSTPDGTVAALKVLSAPWCTPESLRRFRMEAEALRRLDHPGFARYLDHGEALETDEGPRPFLLMELIEGTALRALITERGMDPQQVLRIGLDLCAALEHAHEQGVVHRDLKPENILIEDATAQARIIDLGIARLPEDWRTTVDVSTRSGELLGTVRYMSPEQARGRVDRIGPSSDVYSLAVILYEMLTGKLPYDVQDETLHELLAAILTENPRPLRALRPALPSGFDTIVSSALAKEPEGRPPSVGSLARGLAALQSGDRSHLLRMQWQSGWKRHRTRLGMWISVGLGAIAAAALVWNASTEKTRPPVDASAIQRKIDSAIQLVHFGERTPVRLLAAVDTLLSARETAAESSFEWSEPLRRYLEIRLGEAGYLLGVIDDDPERLRWSSERYALAAEISSKKEERDAIPPALRRELLRMGAHMPFSGKAMTLRELALFDLPVRHLEFARAAAEQAATLADGEWVDDRWGDPPFDPMVSLRDQNIARAMAWNDYGGILTDLAAARAEPTLIREALRAFARADSIEELAANREAYASMQHQYGMALRRDGEWTSSEARLAESELRLRRALDVRRPGTVPGMLTQAELARVQLARGLLASADSASHGHRRDALTEPDGINDVAERSTGDLLVDGCASLGELAFALERHPLIQTRVAVWWAQAIEAVATSDSPMNATSGASQMERRFDTTDAAAAVNRDDDHRLPRSFGRAPTLAELDVLGTTQSSRDSSRIGAHGSALGGAAADSMLGALLRDPTVRRSPRMRAELCLERARLRLVSDAPDDADDLIAFAYLDSAAAAVSPTEYPWLAREIETLRKRH